ncbi:tetraacyldisaccharide 4'-kinase [Telmatobacter sp. DSM 110680]|uniref:Tetraacyldisaccharide 4'-kinase n=1 Tax=Telmatobacter sp. DSM 110680 TaxID=3036704 RepID=A0AAU7DJN8_9BACT
MKRPLLLPLVPLYATGLALRELRLNRGWEQTRWLWYPVISIGNLSTGGSGKTPFAITLARLLSARGFHVDLLSRGYGRTSRESSLVDPDGTADEYGDEPLLIARKSGVPVYVAAERYDAGRLAEQQFIQQGGELSADQVPSVFILDDGFQHRQLGREIDILLVDRQDWQDHLLPAGNLREPRSAANRAKVLAIPASDSGFDAELRSWGWTGPIWQLHRRMEIPQITGPVVAFCGIARPEQFFAGLRSAGLSLAAEMVFADHHRYGASDIESLIASARRKGAIALITTEKDEIRLRNLKSTFPAGLPLEVARLNVEIEDEENAVMALEGLLSSTRLAEGHRKASQR